jgi:hypothetical protein
MPPGTINDLIKNKFASTEWIQCLQCHCGSHGTNETLPHRLVWKIVGKLLDICKQEGALCCFLAALTSRLNRTPPIGEPNATEMPAAAAAESTSRFRAKAGQ